MQDSDAASSDTGRCAPGALAEVLEVKVLLFAGLREQRGVGEERISVRAGTTARQLYEALFPEGAQGRIRVLYAVDRSWTDGTAPLEDGQEVAFVPPLGGG